MNARPETLETERRSAASTPRPKIAVRHLLFDLRDAHDLKANGLYNVARQLVAEQAAAGADAKMVFLREQGRDLTREPIDVPVQVVDLSGRKLRGHRVSIDKSVLDAITAGANRGAVFHLHAARQPMLVPLILRLRRLGILYAMTVHGRYSHVFDESKRTVHRVSALYLQLVERWLLEGALFVQALSAVEREVIRRIAPNARIEVVPNAAYSSRFEGTPLPPKRIGPSARFPVFGFLGRYAIEHKGLDVLVSGFAAYRKAGRKGSLELVGTGPSRDTLAAMARDLGVGEYVTLDGPRFGSEKARTLASWDYFVMSSRYEGIPIGALEAGLSGLPLILSAGTGLREQVVRFKAGFGIEALTTEGMARAFERAGNASAHEWSAMSAAAYRLGLSVGDWSSTAAQLMRLYQAV